MLIFHFITFIVTAYFAYGSFTSRNCFLWKSGECNRDRIPKEFPDTASKLQEACSVVPEYIKCDLKVREDCDPLSNETKSAREIHDYLHSLCEEGNPTLKVLTENIECIAGSVKRVKDLCDGGYRKDEDPREFYRPMVETYIENYDSFNGPEIICLHSFYTVTCVSLIAGIQCGDEVEEAVFESANNVYYYSMYCSPELISAKDTLYGVFREALNGDEKFVKSIQE